MNVDSKALYVVAVWATSRAGVEELGIFKNCGSSIRFTRTNRRLDFSKNVELD